MFGALPKNHFGAILADPPWHYKVWAKNLIPRKKGGPVRHAINHYNTMPIEDIYSLPVADLTAKHCVLFIWVIWPMLEHGIKTIEAWGFKYKTCAFAWMKANATQVQLFDDEIVPDMLTGYWTRSNSEVCLLATKGHPKRLDAGVRQGIIAPLRQHSRKPDGIHERIERLVTGPYLELFARQSRPGWETWGNETTKFDRPQRAASLIGN